MRQLYTGLTLAVARYPKIVYTALGKDIEEKLWGETLNEFEFAGASSIVEGMKSV